MIEMADSPCDDLPHQRSFLTNILFSHHTHCGLFLVVLFLGGCSGIRQSIQNQHCTLDSSNPYEVVRVDPDIHQITLHWKNPSTNQPFKTINHLITSLEKDGHTIIAVTNAGIFEPDLVPTGLYVEQSIELHPINLEDGYGNFYLKPNGVFFVSNDRYGIMESSRFSEQALDVAYALQSGPLLIEDQQVHPAFTLGSKNCRLRSGIGVTSDGHAVIAISNGAVNFHDFAIWYRDIIKADHALYLDGAISELFTKGRPISSKESFASFLAVTLK